MAQTPTILSHNILQGADLSNANYTEDHDPYRMADHLRHTYFQSDSTALVEIIARAKTLTENSTMDNSIDKWKLNVEAGGAGTFTHNTTTPINGDGDGKLISTVDAKWVGAFSDKIFLLKAGRTYLLMGKFLNAAGAGSVTTHIGFINPDMTTLISGASEGVGVAVEGINADYTPTVDIEVRVFVRINTIDAIYIDDLFMSEAPAPDTIIIDKGHNLRDCQIRVRGRYNETGSWFTLLNWTDILTNGVFYKTIPVTDNLISFKIDLQFAADPYEIPLIHLGKKWELPRPFTEPFDNDGAMVSYSETSSLAGVSMRQSEFQARQLDARFDFISADDYENIRKFYEDLKGGELPFWIFPRPTTNPFDIFFMRLTNKDRRAPEGPHIFRSWGFTAQEVVGARV